MNYQTLLGLLVRHALGFAGASLVQKGIITGDQVPQLVEVGAGVVLAGGAVAWSIINKKLQGLLHHR